MSELKPCPFCGGTPIKGEYGGKQISCSNCHVSIDINLIGCQYALHKPENEYKGYEAVYQAIQIWNTRHEPELKELTIEDISQWISVKDRLPEQREIDGRYSSNKVLVAYGNRDKHIRFGHYRGFRNEINEWVTTDNVPFVQQSLITHWMPLPEPPKED